MANETLSELLSQLAHNSARLVRDEIELAKQELREAVKVKAGGVASFAVAGVLGFAAFLVLCLAAVIGLSTLIGPGWAALVVGVALAALAGIVVAVGVKLIKKTSLKPQRTIQTLKEGKQWLKERV